MSGDSRHRHVLVQPETPTRTLTVDFDAFVGKLVRLGESTQKELEFLAAGMDLLRALESESDHFASAAPVAEADAGADFAAQVAALTDEAFDAAYAILAGADGHDGPNPPLSHQSVLSRAVGDLTFDRDLFPALVGAVEGIPPECDPFVGGEFV